MRMQAWGAAIVVAWLLMGTAGQAAAGNTAAARKLLESSLQVSGSITVAPDGSVHSHILEPGVPLGEPVTRLLGETIAKWRFEPVVVDGKAVTAKVPMHLRLLAKPAEGGKTTISIASTYFGTDGAMAGSDQPRSKSLEPPRFPRDALSMGGKGTVYLIVQVGRDGKVANVDAEQVNLRVIGNTRDMDLLRRSFSAAAVRAAKGWTFTVPTTGEGAREAAWLVRVPVDFMIAEDGFKPGKRVGWDTYVPGPRNTSMPWVQDKLRTASSPDALPDRGVFPLRQGAKLLSAPAS